MCFTDKRKRNWIRKEDRVPDRVGYGGAGCHSLKQAKQPLRALTQPNSLKTSLRLEINQSKKNPYFLEHSRMVGGLENTS